MSKEKEDEERGGKTTTAVDNQRIKKSDTRSGKGRGRGWVCDGGEQRDDGGVAGFDVDQLWIWCFVCAAVTPRSGRKMRKGPFGKPSLGLALT